MNFITHFFYDNSSSGSNSYVKQHRTLKEAKEYMRDTIFTSVAGLDRCDMEVFSSLLENETERDLCHTSELSGFHMIYNELYYELNSEGDEDIYKCQIILPKDYNESQL